MQINDKFPQAGSLKNFETSFNYWCKIACKFNPPDVVTSIKELAIQCFNDDLGKLDISKLPPGISDATVKHAKVNYKAAFLVNTGTLNQIKNQWVKNSLDNKNHKNCALLMAMISSHRISNPDLVNFLSTVAIRSQGGWFEFEGKQTANFKAFVACRKCEPSKFYKIYESAFHLHSQANGVAKPAQKTVAAKPAQEQVVAKPAQEKVAAEVEKIKPDVKASAKKMVKIFMPFFIPMAKMQGNYLMPGELKITCLPNGKLETQELFKKIAALTCEFSKGNKFQVGKNASECFKIIEQHSWYKYNTGFFAVEMLIPESAISGIASEVQLMPGCLNAKKEAHPIAENFVIDFTNIIDFHRGQTNTTVVFKSQNCFLLTSSDDLKTFKFPEDVNSAGIFKDADGKIKGVVNFFTGERQLVDLSEASEADRAVLDKIQFPTNAPQNSFAQRREVAGVLRNVLNQNRDATFALVKLSAKLNELKQKHQEKGRLNSETVQLVDEIVKFIKDHVKGLKVCKVPHVNQENDMKAALLNTLFSMNDEIAMELLKGWNDNNSPLKQMPIELIWELIKIKFALDQQSVENKLKS